jgi:predicted ester cyclase
MFAEQHKATLRRLLEGWNAHSLSTMETLADELVTADYVLHDPGIPYLPPGPDGIRQFARGVFEHMPDIHITIEDLVAEGDRVAARLTVHSTEMSTGKPQTMLSMVISRFVDSKIAEEWQLGVPVVAASEHPTTP